jgi:hypothetical protein
MIALIAIPIQGYFLYKQLPLYAFSTAVGDERTAFFTALERRDYERLHENMSEDFRAAHTPADLKGMISEAFPGEDRIAFEDNVSTPGKSIDAVRFTVGEARVVVASRGLYSACFLYDPDAENVETDFGREAGPRSLVAVSDDGHRFLTGSPAGSATVWNVRTGEAVGKIPAAGGRFTAAAFANEGRNVLTGDRDGVVRYWRVASGEELRMLEAHEGAVLSLALSPDGNRAVSGGADGSAKVWDLEAGTEIRAFPELPETPAPVGIAPGGRRVLLGQGKDLLVADVETGETAFRIVGHEGPILAIACSRDGGRILTGAGDDSARLWNAGTGEAIRTLGHHEQDVTAVALSPDGARAVTASEDLKVKVWSLGEASVVAALDVAQTDQDREAGRYREFLDASEGSFTFHIRHLLAYRQSEVELDLCFRVTRTGYLGFEPEITDMYAWDPSRDLAAPKAPAPREDGEPPAEEEDPR